MRQTLKFEVSLESREELQTGLFWKGISGQMESIRCLVPFGIKIQVVHSHMCS